MAHPTDPNPVRHGRRRVWAPIAFLLASLAVRAGCAVPVMAWDVPLFRDEHLYYIRATAMRGIIAGIFHGKLPRRELVDRAYGRGVWPPLHPFLLAIGGLVLGSAASSARLVVAFLSACTTPLVYLLTLRLSSRRAALGAGFLHLLYPSFIAYSHYLWSETAFILFLLACVYFAVLTVERSAGGGARSAACAVLSGLCLGLCALTRAAALPLMPVLPLWLAARSPARRITVAMLATLSCLVVLLPWEAVLFHREGELPPLSTAGGQNLWLGNNPWVPDGYGSCWTHPNGRFVSKPVEDMAEREGISGEAAARTLAVRHIRRDPLAFLGRCADRLRMLWASDYFAIRHMVHAVYPPIPSAAVVVISAAVISSYFVLVGLAICGFLGAGPPLRHKWLILTLVLAGSVPPVATIAMSRLHIPLLALLLPVSGHGLQVLWQRPRAARAVGMGLAVVGFLVWSATALPMVHEHYLMPSSYYRAITRNVDRVVGTRTLLTDRIVLRATGPACPSEIAVELTADDQWFQGSGSQRRLWSPSRQNKMHLDVLSLSSSQAMRIVLSSTAGGTRATIEPIEAANWRCWQPTGLDGISFMWAGGGAPPGRCAPDGPSTGSLAAPQ